MRARTKGGLQARKRISENTTTQGDGFLFFLRLGQRKIMADLLDPHVPRLTFELDSF